MSTPDSAPALLTLRALAKAIGVDAGQLSKEADRPGFPKHATPQGTLYVAAEVLAWRQGNVRQKKPRIPPAPASPASTMPAAAVPVDRPTPKPTMPAESSIPRAAPSPTIPPIDSDPDADADLLRTLYSPDASALEVSRAVVRLVSRRVGRAHERNELYANGLDALKKALQELRAAEAGYIELGKISGDLIPREQVTILVGELCNRMIRVLSSFENTITAEFAIWLADPAVAAMNSDDRARTVRAFIKQTSHTIRNQESDEIDQLVRDAAKAETA